MRPTAETPWATLPPVSLGLQRRLFPKTNTFGIFEFTTNAALPTFVLALSSQKRLHLTGEEGEDDEEEEAGGGDGGTAGAPPSGSGLAVCVGHWSVGASVFAVLPTVFAECGVVFAELGLRLKARVEAGLLARSVVLATSWDRAAGDTAAALNRVGVDVGVGTDGVFLKLESVCLAVFFFAFRRSRSLTVPPACVCV